MFARCLQENLKAMSNVSTAIILDTRWSGKDKQYPIKLRVTFQRKYKLYIINNYHVSEKDFDKIMGDKPREEKFKTIRQEINKKQVEVDEILKKLPYFSFDLFEKIFLTGQRKADDNLFNWIENKSAKLKEQERIKTKITYDNALISIKKYCKKEKLSFYDVTLDFLRGYEKWLIEEQENSYTTLSIYLRCVRAIFNDAIEEGIIVREAYPFGRRKYEIPAGKNIKKALTLSEIQKIYNHVAPEYSSEDRWKDFWIFSYLCNGANVKDICLLKYKNISEGTITFLRSKTKNSNRKQLKPIVVMLSDEIQNILNKWGNVNKQPDSYIFPILSKDMNAERIAATVDQTTQNINKYIKRIAKAEGITKKITTYTARHSFATVLKRSGVSTEFISESIGHADLKTTENYLDSFENEIKKEYAKRLLDFGGKL
jgi:integrase